MRLLVLADQAPYVPLAVLMGTHRPDVVVTLGDLEADGLDVLSRFDVPVLGVYGNHDDGHYLEAANATDLHLAAVTLDGVVFAGFQGSPRYAAGAAFQFSQEQAAEAIRELPSADVLVTHAPPRGIHDEPGDRAHEGFDGLLAYVEQTQPRLHLHGHTPSPPRPDTRVGRTTVVHVVGHRVVDL